ncbi:hypothetical protein DL98DRAFT_579274 [Cadophora sp. DSE1049]|nr:hypothetical protein DL98DRAFT_579274 [Cadophora sp. DSE1049]
MPEDTVADPTDPGTRRPDVPPLTSHGDKYYPMHLPNYPPEIRIPEGVDADDPLSLFTMYYTPEIIEWIVQKTNEHIRDAQDHSNPYARPLLWYPTCAGELYIYFAIRIYMTYNIQHEISDYWSDKEYLAHHDITNHMLRDRFQELHMRVRLAGDKASGPYQRVNKLSEHVQDVNLSVYIPGRDVAVDELALGGTKRSGNKGNKTQAVCLKLLQRLPPPLTGYGYHVFLDNLFVSAKFVAYARTLGFGVTGTCRTNSGIIQELLDLKKLDKNDVIPWGTLYSFPTIDGKTLQIRWKDQAFVLFMTSVLSDDEVVERERKRPKETSSKAKTSRAVFAKGEAVKPLPIPIVADRYNYKIGAVDEGDHLIAQNPGLREIRRGGHQAIEHWIFRLILVNSYLLAERAEVEEPRKLTFRSQQEFRRILVKGLIEKAGEAFYRSPKKRVSIEGGLGTGRRKELHWEKSLQIRIVHLRAISAGMAANNALYTFVKSGPVL